MKYQINESEYRFMDILWDVAPINSMKLVQICMEKLGWKKSTTYTVIKNLSEKQVLCNQNAVVSVLVDREQIQKQESDEFLNKKFKGNVPAFIATFLKDRKLTKKEAERLLEMIENAVEEER